MFTNCFIGVLLFDALVLLLLMLKPKSKAKIIQIEKQYKNKATNEQAI